jgi:metallo-beta-lactamase class B
MEGSHLAKTICGRVVTASWLLAFFMMTATTWGDEPKPHTSCKNCAEWNITQPPFRVFGNTYYVGVHGLASILITSESGHILIDGDLPESVPKIAASIRALGFRVEDVKLILNSHIHSDHAGGLAQLQKLTGAEVAASASSATVLKEGHSGPDDPQFGQLQDIEPVRSVRVIKDGEKLRVGPLEVTAHMTPGHTAGGTSWSWKSCEKERCLNIAYVDSLSAISADNFRFTRNTTYPNVLKDFEKSFATVSALPCDILLTPHPEASDLWERLEKRDRGGADALVDSTACQSLAAGARKQLEARVEKETSHHPQQAVGDPRARRHTQHRDIVRAAAGVVAG